MNYHKIEKLGIEISSIALGTWGIGAAGWGEIDDNESIETIRYMVERGVNVVDTAPVYGLGHSEEIVGKALEGIRDKVYLISKCGITRKKATGFGKDGPVRDSSKPMILKQVDESLERLKTDHLDVLLIHWPDVNTPFEETADALKTLKQQGKIRFSGICNFENDQIDEFYQYDVLDFAQYQFSLLEDKWSRNLEKYHDLGVATMAYGALGGGILTGAYRQIPDFSADDMRLNFYPFFKPGRFKKAMEVVKVMDEIALAHHVPVGEVAINYTADHPFISTALVGVSKRKHAKMNCDALDWMMSEKEKQLLEEAAEKARV
ncbi:MAG: aldo/keto reductase [Erysipelotrichaceae bacterium]|nr:aldo/keto reductase [Erysipelotrichaceae bacterium]